jgi:uncharacterized UBP type Zn finger protein
MNNNGIIPLPNLGLTCWLNSILQCLLNCNIFIKQINKETSNEPIIIAFKCIINKKLLISGLRLLLDILKENIGIQQDALYELIHIIEELCNVKRNIIIKEEYENYLKEWIKTSSDKVGINYNYSKYYTLFFSQLSFITKDNDVRYDPLFTFNLIYEKNICNSLNNYLNTLRYSDSKNIINIISPILVFSINNTKKLKDFHYEETINLKKIINSDTNLIYNFRAAIIHIGNENGGHYISIILINNTWFLCDDNNIRQIIKDDLINYIPYIIFYEF